MCYIPILSLPPFILLCIISIYFTDKLHIFIRKTNTRVYVFCFIMLKVGLSSLIAISMYQRFRA